MLLFEPIFCSSDLQLNLNPTQNLDECQQNSKPLKLVHIELTVSLVNALQ